jgi:predicted nucleic acid-binding protein
MSVFVDTSAFYALVDRDDRYYDEAAAIWRAQLEKQERLLTTNYVVVETSALVRHRLRVAALRTFTLDVLPAVEVVWIGEEEHGAAVSACLTAGKRGLSLVDCASFEVIRRSAVRRAFAFDPDFEEAGFELLE